MIRQNTAVWLGLGTLLIVSAASAALETRSRDDIIAVEHALKVLQKTADLRLRLRRAEGSSWGFALTRSQDFAAEFDMVRQQIPEAFADLQQEVQDNPAQTGRLALVAEPIEHRIAGLAGLISRSAASDRAGNDLLNAEVEDHASRSIAERLDAFAAEERRLLDIRSARSQLSGSLLMAIEMIALTLALLLAAYLIRRAILSDRILQSSLDRSKAVASSLEAKAAEQKQHLVLAHEEARRAALILQNTFDSMAEGVLVVDRVGALLLFNPAAVRTFQLRPGMSLADIKAENRFHESNGVDQIPATELPIAQALRGLTFDRREVNVRRDDRREATSLMVSGRPLRNYDGEIRGAIMVYRDITDALETERLLQQAQKLDAIGKLTGGVAHDFNNMLTVIAGSIEAVMEDIRDRPAAVDIAASVGKAADRCAELIRHLLAFARKQPLLPRDVDVNATVLDIAKLLRPTLGEQIEIQMILDDDTLIAHVDSAQLANSLVNLAINARDAMPDGGKLLLESSMAVLDEAYAAANPGVVPGGYIMVAVSDTGSGMPADVRDRAFEPFFTTKEVGEGTGLGLSMVYGFAKQSGGHVKLYSEESHGTTIRLYLPLGKSEVPIVPLTHGPMPRGTETILVVEDDPLVHDFVLAQLHSLGYATIDVTSGADALVAVAAGRPFDLLFTDVIMPGMNGKDLADGVRRVRPGTPVLYTSGYTDNAMVEHGCLSPDALLLTKPYRRSELAQMLRVALDSPSMACVSTHHDEMAR